MKINILSGFFLLLVMSILLVSCGPGDEGYDFTPKPKGYMRIDFPEKKYRLYDSVCPYSFETPVYSVVEYDKDRNSMPCWINVKYPQFRAQLHVSYLQISQHNNLDTLLQTSHQLAITHEVKASGMDEEVVLRDSAKVYGLIYNIAGNTASNVQFYLTDSTHHFFRGALYFDVAPNIDSTKIVVDFLEQDIMHMIRTFRWKEVGKGSAKE
jgi:gliding motility-associated lipoprotein GldD